MPRIEGAGVFTVKDATYSAHFSICAKRTVLTLCSNFGPAQTSEHHRRVAVA